LWFGVWLPAYVEHESKAPALQKREKRWTNKLSLFCLKEILLHLIAIWKARDFLLATTLARGFAEGCLWLKPRWFWAQVTLLLNLRQPEVPDISVQTRK
jgi:hypothetical protein